MKQKVRAQMSNNTVMSVVVVLLALSASMLAGPEPPQNRQMQVHVGEKAPSFTLPSTNGKMVSLTSFRGHNVLIDFYEGYW
ncbi:MAG: redoxin domain-containing protein [Terriglobia bacterium]